MKKGNTGAKSKRNTAARDNDEIDMSHLNETVEETERRRDAEANLAQLGRGPASAAFDAPFAAGLGSAGVIPNNEDGDYRDSGSMLRIDLGDGSIDGMSDLNDVSGNPQVYNGPKGADELADISESGIGGMSIEHVNDIEHGTGALPEEVKAHEARRTAQRVHFKTEEGNPLLEPAPRAIRDDQKEMRRSATRGSGGMIRSGADGQLPSNVKSETTITGTKRSTGSKTSSKKSSAKKASGKKSAANNSTRSTGTAGQKSSAKKTASKKSGAKNSPAKTATKKSTAKKPASKNSASKKAGAERSNVGSKKSGGNASRKTAVKGKGAQAHARSTNNTKAKQSVNVGPNTRGRALDMRTRGKGSGVQRSGKTSRSR